MKNILFFSLALMCTLNLFSSNTPRALNSPIKAADSAVYGYKLKETIQCEGLFEMHLQGISTDKKGTVYWSFTNELVRTDLKGKILTRIKVLNHHGDLCYVGGKLYVAVNLGKFNELPGQEDSWIFVYDARNLKELGRYKAPELVHGAGGISSFKGHFFVVGGLPQGFTENYIYQYDNNFNFIKRHVIPSGYTYKGIQTAEFHDGRWWFGCYGSPKLIRTDLNFQILDKSDFNASLGIVGYSKNKLLIGNSSTNSDKLHVGTIGVYER